MRQAYVIQLDSEAYADYYDAQNELTEGTHRGISLTWNGLKWVVPEDGFTVKIVCDNEIFSTWPVTFVNRGETYATREVIDGNTVTPPATPTRNDYRFDGWYLNGNPYDFDTLVTGDITLEAHWTYIGDDDDDHSNGGSGSSHSDPTGNLIISLGPVDEEFTFTVILTDEDGDDLRYNYYNGDYTGTIGSGEDITRAEFCVMSWPSPMSRRATAAASTTWSAVTGPTIRSWRPPTSTTTPSPTETRTGTKRLSALLME